MTLLSELLPDERQPVGSHAFLMVAFNAALLALAVRAEQRRGVDAPKASDIVLLGMAAHKISRLVARERVTTPLRAPFVEGQEEEPTGKGLQRALGELLTCPYCVAPWITLGLGAGMVYRPGATRFVSSLFASLVVSDVLHHGYSTLRELQSRTKESAVILRSEAKRRTAENGPDSEQAQMSMSDAT